MPALRSEPVSSPGDEELVLRARQGDGEVVGELVSRYRPAIVRFCFGCLGNAQDAEDAAQDVFGKLSPGCEWPQGAFRPWLYRVARNRCLDLAKMRGRNRVAAGSFVHDSRLPSPRTGPRTAVLREERREHTRRLVAAMPEAQREVLVLRYFEDLSRREIAEVLGLSVSVVKLRLFEARQQLKERLREREP